jgi:hypothetical protein
LPNTTAIAGRRSFQAAVAASRSNACITPVVDVQLFAKTTMHWRERSSSRVAAPPVASGQLHASKSKKNNRGGIAMN